MFLSGYRMLFLRAVNRLNIITDWLAADSTPEAVLKNRVKKENLIILILGIVLLAGMLLTIFFGGEKSRHGVGNLLDALPGNSSIVIHLSCSSQQLG